MNEISDGAVLLDKKRNNTALIILYLVIFLQIFIILLMCFFYVTVTDGESMENTLQDKQLFIVQRLAFGLEHGDVITVNTAADGEPEHMLIKRVIGLGGDKLLFMRSQSGGQIELYRRNYGENKYTLLDEPYIKAAMSAAVNYYDTPICSYIPNLTEISIDSENATAEQKKLFDDINAASVEVAHDYVYFMGDNRNNSLDSRYYGARPLSKVRGKLIKTLKINGFGDKFFRFVFSLND